MKKYYFHDGEDHKGPYSSEELQKFDIRPNTPIWYEGLDTWTEARNVFDMKGAIPPPLVRTSLTPKEIEKTEEGWSDEKKVLVIAFFFFGIFLLVAIPVLIPVAIVLFLLSRILKKRS